MTEMIKMMKMNMNKNNNLNHKGKSKWTSYTFVVIVILAIISLALMEFTTTGAFEAFRIVFGSVFVLFLPGFVISWIFFPKTKEFDEKKNEAGDNGKEESGKGAIDWIERIALSFALSIAVVPLIIFYLNLIGIRINLLNSFLTILGIIVIALIVLQVRKGKE